MYEDSLANKIIEGTKELLSTGSSNEKMRTPLSMSISTSVITGGDVSGINLSVPSASLSKIATIGFPLLS